MTTSLTTPYGGYAITSVKEAEGREGPMFSATITLNGQRAIHVSNDGNGSCHRYQPIHGDYEAFRAALVDFETFARHWNQDDPHAGIEDSDALVYRLLEVAELNRKRVPIFLLDGEDFFATGVAHGLRSTSHDEAVLYLRAAYPGRVRLWSRERSEFVSVD